MPPAHDFESLGDLLRKPELRDLAARAFRSDPNPDAAMDEPVANCSRCGDSGLLRRDVPASDPHFGKPIECPCGIMASRRRMRIWRASQVPPTMLDYTLDTFANLTGKAELVADLRAWQASDRDALFVGPVGLGKTGLAVAMLLEAMRQGTTGLYVVAPTFLSRIRATYHRASDRDEGVDELDVLESLIGVNLLVLDDLGKVALTEWGQEKLFTVVNERYLYGRRTIYTSNLDVDDGALEQHLWPATWDRIRGRADIFALTGDSLRGRPV